MIFLFERCSFRSYLVTVQNRTTSKSLVCLKGAVHMSNTKYSQIMSFHYSLSNISQAFRYRRADFLRQNRSMTLFELTQAAHRIRVKREAQGIEVQ